VSCRKEKEDNRKLEEVAVVVVGGGYSLQKFGELVGLPTRRSVTRIFRLLFEIVNLQLLNYKRVSSYQQEIRLSDEAKALSSSSGL
jgi:hypothetical protein